MWLKVNRELVTYGWSYSLVTPEECSAWIKCSSFSQKQTVSQITANWTCLTVDSVSVGYRPRSCDHGNHQGPNHGWFSSYMHGSLCFGCPFKPVIPFSLHPFISNQWKRFMKLVCCWNTLRLSLIWLRSYLIAFYCQTHKSLSHRSSSISSQYL